MDGLFTQRLRVRAYDCDSLGHVNNSIYLQFLQQATLDAHAWHAEGPDLPTPRTLAVEYQTPARYGDELDVMTWVAAVDGGVVTHGYEIIRPGDGAVVLRAQMQWDMHRPVETPAANSRSLPLKPLTNVRDNGARPWYWHHTVHRYEIDLSETANLAVYFHWLEEATFRTAHVSGWTMERMRGDNFITLQYRHDAEFFAPARNGEDIEIVSRLIDVRRVRGTWIHEIVRVADKTLLLRDYSTGAFLDWQGSIRPAPAGMMERLCLGESGA